MNISGAVAILGMHRSGTSCLAGTLESRGLALGDVSNQSPHNKKGNKENKAFRQLNEAVLEHSGGSWDNPPTFVTWTQEHREERDRLLDERENIPVWGFKDPRTVLTFGFWQEAIPHLPAVATFRNPVSVSSSLKARPGLLPKMAPEVLWLAYNTALLKILETTKAPIVCFDWDRDRYLRCTTQIARKLGLKGEPGIHFYDETLDHQGRASLIDGSTPPQLKEIYDALMAKAIETERAIQGHERQA